MEQQIGPFFQGHGPEAAGEIPVAAGGDGEAVDAEVAAAAFGGKGAGGCQEQGAGAGLKACLFHGDFNVL